MQYLFRGAFSGCTSLRSITIPDGVTYIGSLAFSDCDNLTNINIPDGVSYIDGSTFEGCSSLKRIAIPNGVTYIDMYAFEGCNSLETISIPPSLTFIDYHAFDDCNSIKKILISDVDAWCRINFRAYIPGNLYIDNKLLTEVTLPDGIAKIGEYTFQNRSSLETIIIPDGVTDIAKGAFSDCTSLRSITIPDSVTFIDDKAFYGCISLTNITIPDSVTFICEETFYGCNSLTNIIIPDSVTSIGDNAFYGCGSLINITIPDSVAIIGEYAFSECSSLKGIIIPGSVTSVEQGAFYSCNNLASVTIPNSVTNIGEYAFSGCSSLSSISIPDSVTCIGDSAFRDCSSLSSITIPDSVTSIGSNAFYGCDNLKSLTIPNSVTYIDDWAFPRYSNDTNDFVIFTQSQYVKEYCKKNGYAYFDKTAPSIAKLTSHNGSDIRVYFEKRDEAIEEDYLFWNECVLGYQIKYADNKNMTGAKSIMLKDKKAASKVITGLKNGKTYYVQIQHYLKSGKVSYWSKWSPVTSVTVGQTPYNTNVSKLSTYIGSHIKVDWTKTAGASGYHIKYADNSSMTGAKEVMVKGNSTFTKTLTGLKNGKTYYVKIQTYRTVSGKTYWSSWSPAKSIKVDQIPYGSSIKNLTRVSATQMKVTWDKAPSASGYHIQYRWYDGNSGKYVTKDIIINGNGTVSKTITGLKKYGDYEVRIQTFRKISGKTYWSSWSKYKYVYLW